MNFKIETRLYCKNTDLWRTEQDQERTYYKATRTEGHFRFESAAGVQITIIDKSGAEQSQFYKDGTQRDVGICDAKDFTFQMKGLFPEDFEVTLFYKVLHFSDEFIWDFSVFNRV